MRFKEAKEAREKRWVGGSATKLLCPDSGQVDEPLSPPSITKRCRKSGKGDSLGVPWRMMKQGLTVSRKLVGDANWRRS